MSDYVFVVLTEQEVRLLSKYDPALRKAKLAEKLDSALTKIVGAGQFTTIGGDANETIAVDGMLSTDTVLVNIMKPGAGPVTIVSATAADGQIDVVLSGNPSTDHILTYLVVRN